MTEAQKLEQQIHDVTKIMALLQRLPESKKSYLLGVIDTLSAIQDLESQPA